MTYDDWKLDNPFDDEKDNECGYCGEPTDKDFCNKECYKAYQND